jgi:ribosomal protein S18 acetylase RimI-like enzyme
MLVAIRRASPKDAKAIANGEHEVAKTPGLLNALPGEIPAQVFFDKINALEQNDRGLYLVAERESGVVGHLLLDPMPLAANSHICTLTVVVYPKWQRLGIGRELLSFAIQWARMSAKVEKIELMVRASNEPAIRLYQSMGFVEEGRIRNRVKEPSGVYHDDIAMGLFL